MPGWNPKRSRVPLSRLVPALLLIGGLWLMTSSALAEEEEEITLRALAEGVWLHTSYYTFPGGSRFPSNGLVIRDGDELTLVDTAWGELRTVDLLTAIEFEIGLPVTRAVVTHYHGTFVDGTVFDSSVERGEPAEFGVNQVIPGWTEALQLMSVGDKWRIACPPKLAYGEQGAGDSIPPNTALVFDIHLIAVKG